MGEGKRGSQLRVLVVDDEPMVVSALQRSLVRAGHHVEGATSPDDALVLVQRSTFDCAVVDWVMPGIGGAGFVRRAAELVPGLAIVLTSSCAGLLAAFLDGEVKGVPVLPKPCSTDELLAAIENAVALRGR